MRIGIKLYSDFLLEGREVNDSEVVKRKSQLYVQYFISLKSPPIGDPTHNLGMCPDRELNSQPFRA